MESHRGSPGALAYSVQVRDPQRLGGRRNVHVAGRSRRFDRHRRRALQPKIKDIWQHGDWGDANPNVAAIPAAVAAHEKVKTPEEWEYSNKANVAVLPEWANDAVFYQIFPLGYFGAPTVNDQSAKMVPRLKQIRDHYKHFQELGIDAVYFSPLFESGTHGYDTFDYFEIDRRLGDVKLFKQIVKELHEIGIKVVLDGVFNHTGKGHFAFQDLMKNGASDSEFANWYHVGVRRWDYEGWCDAKTGSSFSYDCWEGHPVLPRLNLDEPAVRNHIFDIAKFWLEEVGIDGWRLDVAHEIEPDFWREFRKVCDSVDKDCLTVGEMIHGNYNDWVGHDRLHSGTNYQMSHATWHSLNEHNYEYFYNALRRENNLFNGLKLVNFLGNHDVKRIASNLDNPAHYTHAMVVLTLMKGIPCLYYGDEFGMEGTPEDGTDEHSGGDDAMRSADAGLLQTRHVARGWRVSARAEQKATQDPQRTPRVLQRGLAGDGQHQHRRRGVAVRTNHRRARDGG